MARQQGLNMDANNKTLIITDIAYQYVDLKNARASRYECYEIKQTAIGTFINGEDFTPEINVRDIPLIRLRNAKHMETIWGMYPEVAEILGEPLQCIADQGKQMEQLSYSLSTLRGEYYKSEEELALIKNTVTHATVLQRLRYLFTGKLRNIQ